MYYRPLDEFCPEIASRETRRIAVQEDQISGLPAGTYSVEELFCATQNCDCRRVMFFVTSDSHDSPEAVVAYGWESSEFYATWMGDDDPVMIAAMQGPILNRDSTQGACADSVLDLIECTLLKDDVFLGRLKRHYRAFKDALATGSKESPVRVEKVGRNAPCPCDSGKKYKKCCGRASATGQAPAQNGEQRVAWQDASIPGLGPGTFFRFRLQIVGIEPPIWRRFLLRTDMSFFDLHVAVQDLGWTNSHLWQFVGLEGGVIAGCTGEFYPPNDDPAAETVSLDTHFKRPGSRCAYVYDFGDDWKHDIMLEAVEERSEVFGRALVDGNGYFPPEDCGGVSGYHRLRAFLETGKDPWGDEEHLREWGPEMELGAFDLQRERQKFGHVLQPSPAEGVPEEARESIDSIDEPGLCETSVEPVVQRPQEVDRSIVDAIMRHADAVMGAYGEEFGLKIRVRGASYTRFNAKIGLEIATIRDDGLVMDKLATDFLERCEEFGLAPQDLGRTFCCGGERLRIVGMRARAKQPIILQVVPGSTAAAPPSEQEERVHMTASQVRSHLANAPGDRPGEPTSSMPPLLEADGPD